MARKTLPEKRTLYAGLQKGVRTRWKGREPVRIDGVDYTMKEVDDILQQLLDAIRGVELAEGALHGAVAKRPASAEEARETRKQRGTMGPRQRKRLKAR
jgi:hypothetical protein